MTGPTVGRASLIVGRELPLPAGEPLPWRRGHPVDVDDPPAGHGLPLVLPAAPPAPAAPSGLFSRPEPTPAPATPAPTSTTAAPTAAPDATSDHRGTGRLVAVLALLALVLWWRRRRCR